MKAPSWIILVWAAVLFSGCTSAEGTLDGGGIQIDEDLADLGPSLDATFDDPILLTVAAARPRTQYLVDEGYTLAKGADGIISLVTDNAGDLGLAFLVDGRWIVSSNDMAAPVRIRNTSSDTLVFTLPLTKEITASVRFAAVTSRVATAQVVIYNSGGKKKEVGVSAWLRRCTPFIKIASMQGGVAARHRVEIPDEQRYVGPGTYVEDLSDAFVGEPAPESVAGTSACSDDLAGDIEILRAATGLPSAKAALLGLRFTASVPPGGSTSLVVRRGVVDAAKEATMGSELEAARGTDLLQVLKEGAERLKAIPELKGLSRAQGLVYRSSFTLLDQLMMPAEGKLKHDYYLFGREPTWWFGRLGQHIHESLSMILMAHFDPRSAVESQRVFIDRVEDNGYIPYNIGPVVEQTAMGTATAPMFSYVSWEIYKVVKDDAFLADAYRTGQLLHRFYVVKRDKDGDGLCEWGGYPITESVRDLENVIWVNVASPDKVEEIALNSWLVMEENTLALMADKLGKTGEAAAWRGEAEKRAGLVNGTLWDAATGFYYHAAMGSHSFSFKATDDLKRMESAGFLPLWAGFAPPDRAKLLISKLEDPSLFWRTGGIPALAASDQYYSPDADRCCRWRGPVWVQWQFMLMRALLEQGRKDLAAEIVKRTYDSVESQLRLVHQFRELYNPDDLIAPNTSMPNYIWSSLVALMMLETAEVE